MKCSYHPDEYIRCININPTMQDDRVLCIDCYRDQLMEGNPSLHIQTIEKIIDNPLLLFSLNQSGYDKFNNISKHRDRYHAILDVHLVQIYDNKVIERIKKFVQITTDLLLEQLNQYSATLKQIWTDYDNLNEYVWDHIGYKGVKAHLKVLISKEPISYDKYDQITEDLYLLFKKLDLDNNAEFIKKYDHIMNQFNSTKNMNIIELWKQNQQNSKVAFNEFISHHEQIFSIQLENKNTKNQLKDKIAKLIQKPKCCVCKAQDATHAAIPCGHLAYCDRCKDQSLGYCSLCKHKWKSMNKIYL